VNRALICPPSRRGHTWRELSPSQTVLAQDLLRERICARCGARGRVNKQGLIDVVRPAEIGIP